MHDIFGTVFHDFARQEWICEKGSCHVNNIGFSGCDDLFHLRRIIQTADRCDRNGNVFFDLSCEVNVASVVFEHRRMRIAEASLIRSGGNVKQIDAGLQCLCDADTFFQIIAALEQLGTAETELDREHRADSGADGIEYLTGKAAAVFQASAVLIGSVVEIRGEELVDQPAMAAVDHDHLETGAFGKACYRSVCLYDLINLLFRQCADRYAVRACRVGRAPLAHFVLSRFIGHVSSGIHTGMGQFQARHSAVAGNCIGSVRCRCQGI